MFVTNLALRDWRCYDQISLELQPGISIFLGANGQGKTNLVEAIGYLATLASHRVSADAALVRHGADRAVLRCQADVDGQVLAVDLEVNFKGANRAQFNQVPVRRLVEIVGLIRSVTFAPEDLALVKGDPDGRRRFLDGLLVQTSPRLAGVIADYEKVLRQRASLLKSAALARRYRADPDLRTLDVWDSHLAEHGAKLISARLALVDRLAGPVGQIYAALAHQGPSTIAYHSCLPVPPAADIGALAEQIRATLTDVRGRELERGVNLIGPHRDDLNLHINGLPARGYASHGEAWSLALALRLASFDVLTADGASPPILILDDVFAELDTGRRQALANQLTRADQVLITAAVPADVPNLADAVTYSVVDHEVSRV